MGEQAVSNAPSICPSIRASHRCIAYATYGRTDVRTNEHSNSSIMHLSMPYRARAYAARFASQPNPSPFLVEFGVIHRGVSS